MREKMRVEDDCRSLSLTWTFSNSSLVISIEWNQDLCQCFWLHFIRWKLVEVGWSQCFLSLIFRVCTQVLQCWCDTIYIVYPDIPWTYYHITSFISSINIGCFECLWQSNSWPSRPGWGMGHRLRVVEAWNRTPSATDVCCTVFLDTEMTNSLWWKLELQFKV